MSVAPTPEVVTDRALGDKGRPVQVKIDNVDDEVQESEEKADI